MAEISIQDPDGSLQVRPDGLKFDAPFAFEHEVLSRPRTELETRLLDYVAMHVHHRLNLRMLFTLKRLLMSRDRAADPRVATWLSTLETKRSLRERTSGKAYRFREQLLMSGQECEIAGSVLTDRGGRVLQKSPAAPFLLSTTLGTSLEDKLRHRTAVFAGWSTCCIVVGALIVVFGVSS